MKVYEKRGKKVIAINADSSFVDKFDKYVEEQKTKNVIEKINQSVIVCRALSEYMENHK